MIKQALPSTVASLNDKSKNCVHLSSELETAEPGRSQSTSEEQQQTSAFESATFSTFACGLAKSSSFDDMCHSPDISRVIEKDWNFVPSNYLSIHQLPPEGVPDETHGQECIVLPDDYVITDMDFRVFVESLPSDVWFTIIADSCHSGGLVQHLEEQIGGGSQFQQPPYWSNSRNDHVGTSSEPLGVLEKHRQYRQGYRLVSKGLTVDRFIRILSKRTQRRVEVGSIRANLYDIFKDEASFTVKSFAKDIFLKLQKNKMWNTNGNLAAQFFQQRLNDEGSSYAIPAFAEVQYPLDTAALCNKCVLISACQSYEEAADVEDGSSYGVLTNAIKTILDQQTGPIENFRLVVLVKRLLEKQGHSQHPGLYCGEKKASSVFICY